MLSVRKKDKTMSVQSSRISIPADILALAHERDELRRKGKYEKADDLKRQIEEAGYGIKDNPRGAHLIVLPDVEIDGVTYRTSRQVPSLLEQADTCAFSVNMLARDSFEATRRCLESVERCAGGHDIEIMLVDNGSQDELYAWACERQQQNPRLHVARISRPVGEAEARNIGLKRSLGQHILLLDSAIEVTGDVFTPLAATLSALTWALPACAACFRKIYATSRKRANWKSRPLPGCVWPSDALCSSRPVFLTSGSASRITWILISTSLCGIVGKARRLSLICLCAAIRSRTMIRSFQMPNAPA